MNSTPDGKNIYKYTQRIVVTAMLIAISVIVKYFFKHDLIIGGVQMLRITFHGPFTLFAGILFGPVYGGLAAAAADLLSFFLKPQNVFMWQLTVTAALNGVCSALLWHFMRKVDIKHLGYIIAVIFGLMILSGTVVFITVNAFSESGFAAFLAKLGGNGANVAAFILILTGVLGFAAILLWQLILKKLNIFKRFDKVFYKRFLRLIVIVGIPGLIFNSVNSVILFNFSSGVEQAFLFYWIPRFITKLFFVLFDSYILLLLMNTYSRFVKGDIF